MTSRLLACLLTCLLLAAPASAQDLRRASLDRGEATLEEVRLEALESERIESPVDAIAGMNLAERGASIAAAVLRALRSQNDLPLNYSPAEHMHAYLRHPDAGPASAMHLIQRAGNLYDGATSIRSSRYDLMVDPFKMQCRLRIKLSRLMSK